MNDSTYISWVIKGARENQKQLSHILDLRGEKIFL